MHIHMNMHMNMHRFMESYTNKNIRKLNKTGRASYSVILPKDFVKKLKWKERQKLKVSLRGKTITIKDA